MTSFFLKYSDYKNGLRFVIDGHIFQVLHNQESKPEDEIVRGFEGLQALLAKLRILYGEKQGEVLFLHLFQELFALSERVKRKKCSSR